MNSLSLMRVRLSSTIIPFVVLTDYVIGCLELCIMSRHYIGNVISSFSFMVKERRQLVQRPSSVINYFNESLPFPPPAPSPPASFEEMDDTQMIRLTIAELRQERSAALTASGIVETNPLIAKDDPSWSMEACNHSVKLCRIEQALFIDNCFNAGGFGFYECWQNIMAGRGYDPNVFEQQ
jgi:hypothetical protein